MRIVIDLDGVICTLKKPGETYADVQVMSGAVEKLQALRDSGHYIIIQTARHMLSTQGNVGVVQKKVAKTTLDWLEKYKIPYDEIYFGKPYGHVYIDDNALEFSTWDKIGHQDLNTNKINVVIPMAGEGSRFANVGIKTPKPLIKINGKEMYKWAASSFDTLKGDVQFIFIILKRHADEFDLDKNIREAYPQAKIIILDEVTRGQSETVLQAKESINNLNKLLIFNADTYFVSNDMQALFDDHRIDGAAACFVDKTDSEKFSFVKSDKDDFMLEVTEKVRISNNASNGLYYFRRGKDFVALAEQAIDGSHTAKGEFYVMPLYTPLIERGFRLKMFLVDENHIIGTPDELEVFKKNLAQGKVKK